MHLLRRDVVHVGVDRPGRGDEVLAGDDLGPRPDEQLGIDAGLQLRVARLADADDAGRP